MSAPPSSYEEDPPLPTYGADPTFGYGVSGVNVGDYGPLHTLSGDDLIDAIATLGFSQFEGNENYQTAIEILNNVSIFHVSLYNFER